MALRARRRGAVKLARIAAGAILPLALAAAAAAAPEPQPSVSASADRVFAFAGPWACTAADGSRTMRGAGTRDGDVIEVVKNVRPAHAAPYASRDRYAFDRAAGVWRVDFDAGTPNAVRAISTPWTGNNRTWSAIGRDAHGTVQRVRFEALGTQIARTVMREEPPGSSRWAVYDSELCARGDAMPAPPPQCAVPNVPAQTIVAAEASMRDVPRGTPLGTVVVVVGLDEQSRIESTAIASSPSAALNGSALAAARASRFQTEVRGCRPIAAKYIFSVTFGP